MWTSPTQAPLSPAAHSTEEENTGLVPLIVESAWETVMDSRPADGRRVSPGKCSECLYLFLSRRALHSVRADFRDHLTVAEQVGGGCLVEPVVRISMHPPADEERPWTLWVPVETSDAIGC